MISRTNQKDISFVLEVAELLPALAYPNHLAYLGSWGFAHLAPSCNSNYFGYKKRSQSGFSLIEVMLAVFLLSFSLVGLAKLNSQIERGSELTWQRLQASQLAEMKLEILYNQSQIASSFDKIDDGCEMIDSNLQVSDRVAGQSGGCDISHLSSSATVGSNLYVLEWQINSSVGQMKQVTLKVSWLDRWEQTYFISLTTQLTP